MGLPEPKRHSKYDHIARTYAHNTDWAPFPGQSNLKPGTRETYRARINKGLMLQGRYEAKTQDRKLYIRPRKTDE